MAEIESKVIGTEEFYAGALLKFEWLDNYDIILLMEFLAKAGYKFSDNKKNCELDKYMVMEEGITSLKGNYTLDTKVASKIFGIITLRQKFRMMVRDEILEFFDNIDFIYFVLKKIKYLVREKDRQKIDFEMFSPLEQSVVMDLMAKGFCVCEYGTETELDINLSKLGELEFFLKNNSLAVEQFKQEALNSGFSLEIVERYLLSQNLDRNIENILDIKRLKAYYQLAKLDEGTTRK